MEHAPMIISVRGTNGAGKSTLVREVMKGFTHDGGKVYAMQYPPEENKHRPMGYICRNADQTKALFIIGHYENAKANGGVDTLPNMKYAHDLALNHHSMGFDVLMEGKNFTESPAWILKQHEDKLDVRVVLIDTPVKLCIKSVIARGHKIQEKTIRGLHAKSRVQFRLFERAGVPAYKGTRRQCLEKVQSWLK
jgi:uridine kinase